MRNQSRPLRAAHGLRRFDQFPYNVHPAFIAAAALFIVLVGLVLVGRRFAVYVPAVLVGAYVTWRSFLKIPGVAGVTSSVRTILILRPFRSTAMEQLFRLWVAPALWQFGQPIIPLDPASATTAKLAAPREAATRRDRFAFFRVLDRGRWLTDIQQLIMQASIVVVDTSIYRPAVAEELRIISDSPELTTKLVSIHQSHITNTPDEDRALYRNLSSAVIAQLEGSIAFSIASVESLESLWNELVVRSCEKLHIPLELAPHYPAPKRWLMNARSMTVALSWKGMSAHIAAGRGIRFSDADQTDWVQARGVLRAIGGARIMSSHDAEFRELKEIIIKHPGQFAIVVREHWNGRELLIGRMLDGLSTSRLVRLVGVGLINDHLFEQLLTDMERSAPDVKTARLLLYMYLGLIPDIAVVRERSSKVDGQLRSLLEQTPMPTL
jgi:hypothetical protein